MTFTEKLRDRLPILKRRRWAYKVVKVSNGKRLSHQWEWLPKAWRVEYKPDKWVSAPDHSLLMVFSNETCAREWLRWGGGGEIWKVEAQGVRTFLRRCYDCEYAHALTSFWNRPNSRVELTDAPDGTLGATRVKLVRKVS